MPLRLHLLEITVGEGRDYQTPRPNQPQMTINLWVIIPVEFNRANHSKMAPGVGRRAPHRKSFSEWSTFGKDRQANDAEAILYENVPSQDASKIALGSGILRIGIVDEYVD